MIGKGYADLRDLPHGFRSRSRSLPAIDQQRTGGSLIRTEAKTAAFALIEHKEHTNMKPKNTICLWFDKGAHEAARLYAVTFPDSKVTAVHEAPGAGPGRKKGNI